MTEVAAGTPMAALPVCGSSLTGVSARSLRCSTRRLALDAPAATDRLASANGGVAGLRATPTEDDPAAAATHHR